MKIRPIYQTKHVQVEMTRDEVDALKILYAMIQRVFLERQYSIPGTPENEKVKEAWKNRPKIIEEPAMVRPKL